MMRRIAALLLLAAIPTSALAQAAPAPATIRAAVIGYADATSLPIYGEASGIFKKYGLDAKVTSFNGGGAIIAAIAGGSLDVGFSNLVSAASAIQRGIPVMVLTPATLFDHKERGDNVLVKTHGSKLQTGADLTGKTVGVSVLNGIPHYASRAWIDTDGGDSSATKFVEIYHPEMIAALAQGRVDAASLSEPYLTPARAANRAIGAPEDAIAPEFLLTVHFTTLAWAKANPDLLRRYVTAIAKTAQWANAHPDLVVPILAKYSKQPEDAVRTMPRALFSDTLVARQLQPVIDVTAKYGNIARFPAEEMVYR